MAQNPIEEQIDKFLLELTREKYSKHQADNMLELIPKGFLKPIHFALIKKLDTHKFTESSINITASTDNYESFVYSLLMRELTVNQDIVDALVNFARTHREGALSRHFFMATFFASITSKDFPDKFYSSSTSLMQIIEFLFSEMYQVDGSATTHTQEELKVIHSQGMGSLKKLVLGFIKHNIQALRLDGDVIEVADYFTLDDHFELKVAQSIPANTLIKASFVRFLGNLIAKVDFARFYAEKLGQSKTIAILKDLQGLLKPFHELVFTDSLRILESDSKLLQLRKYKEFCEEPGNPKSMVNLHATIVVSDKTTPLWDGYGSLVCIYILRNLLPQTAFLALTPLKLLKLVSSSMSAIPQDYQGGIEYFFPILHSLLRKLQASQLVLENNNEQNCFLTDFLFTLHTIDYPNTKEAQELIREFVEYLLSLTCLQNRYLFMVKFLDMATDAKVFCGSKGFSSAISSLYWREVNSALSRDLHTPELFLRDTPLLRFLQVIFLADPKQTGNIASSSRPLTSNPAHRGCLEGPDRESRGRLVSAEHCEDCSRGAHRDAPQRSGEAAFAEDRGDKAAHRPAGQRYASIHQPAKTRLQTPS